MFFVAYLIEIPLYLLLKLLLKRSRPSNFKKFTPAIQPADRFSFPSGHSTAAFLFAALIIANFPVWSSVVYLWAFLVGMSRIVLGVHYPSDVIAGALLGTGVGAFVISLFL